jgi:hypothetical protein
MPSVNGYTDLNSVKNALGLGPTSLSPDDQEIEAAITAVSRTIDDYCGRFFYSTAGTVLFTAEDYLYTPLPGDWSAITSITIDDANSGTPNIVLDPVKDYRLETNKAFPGWPFTGIIITTYNTSYSLPVGITEGIKAIGQRGWSSIPPAIQQAALLQTVRTHSRRAVPFGVAGSPDGGVVRLLSRLDPDVELMCRPYRVAGMVG